MRSIHVFEIFAIVAAVVVSACSGGGVSTIAVPSRSMGVNAAQPNSTGTLIYACYLHRNECVWFERGHPRVKGVIGGLAPVALTVDNAGDVYIVSMSNFGEIKVYPKGSTSLLRTLSNGNIPTDVAVDAKGTVFVSQGNGDIAVYANGSTTITRTISPGVRYIDSIAVDEHRDLLICHFGRYSAKQCSELLNARLPAKVVYQGLRADDIAFDTAGNVALSTKDGTQYLDSAFARCGFDATAKQTGVAFDRQSGDIFKSFPNVGDIDEETYSPCAAGSVEYTYNLGFHYNNHPNAVAVDPGSGI